MASKKQKSSKKNEPKKAVKTVKKETLKKNCSPKKDSKVQKKPIVKKASAPVTKKKIPAKSSPKAQIKNLKKNNTKPALKKMQVSAAKKSEGKKVEVKKNTSKVSLLGKLLGSDKLKNLISKKEDKKSKSTTKSVSKAVKPSKKEDTGKKEKKNISLKEKGQKQLLLKTTKPEKSLKNKKGVEPKKEKGRPSKKTSHFDELEPLDDYGSDINADLLDDLEKADVDKAIREELVEHLSNLDEDYSLEDLFHSLKDIDYFNGHTGDCLERGCDNPPTTMGYCRLHYIKRWNDIKKKIKILNDGKLQTFIEELVNKYPPKYIEAVLDDLKDEKTFFKALKELNIESDEEFDDVALDEPDDDQDIVFETKSTLKTTVFTEED